MYSEQMEKTAEKIFIDLKDDISAYAGLKLRLLKLMAIERAARIIAVLSHAVILMLMGFFMILFLFMALGFYLSQLMDNLALGFLVVGGIYVLLTLGMIWAKDRVRLRLMNLAVEVLDDSDDDDDEEDDDHKNKSTDSTRTIDSGEAADQAGEPDRRTTDLS